MILSYDIFESRKIKKTGDVSKNNLPLFFTDRMKELLERGKLKFLLDLERNHYSEISYIDLTNRNNTISCLSKSSYDKLEFKRDVWKTSLRQNMTLGRFFKRLLPEETDITIEEYVNEYKFSYNVVKKDLGNFKIVSGIDMAKWYWERTYAPGGGSLNSSCMKHIKSQRRLGIYMDNPSKVRLLIMTDTEDKLLGRALLWNLDSPKGRVLMDRIYYTERYIERMFYDYAFRRGYLTKEEVEEKNITLKVYMPQDYGPPHENPYMDTLRFFIIDDENDTYYLTNRFKNFKYDDYYEYNDHD